MLASSRHGDGGRVSAGTRNSKASKVSPGVVGRNSIELPLREIVPSDQSGHSQLIIMAEPPDPENGLHNLQYEQSVHTALRRRVDDFLGLKFFPTIKDHHDYVKFRRYQYSRFDMYSAIFSMLIYGFIFITRSNLPRVPVFGAYFAVAFALALTTFVILLVIVGSTIISFYSTRSVIISHHFDWLVDLCKELLQSKVRWYAEELLPVLTSVSVGLFLIARVYAGQCLPDISIWMSQSCNPVASCLSIPHDSVILGYATPIFFQLVLKGIR